MSAPRPAAPPAAPIAIPSSPAAGRSCTTARSAASSASAGRWKNALADELYDQKQGTTDSELFFLLMLDEGLDADPQGAVARATGTRDRRRAPRRHRTVAEADRRLLGRRDAVCDPLCHRRPCADALYRRDARRRGRCIVSEPFDREGGNWQAIPPSSFVTMADGAMTIRPFAPCLQGPRPRRLNRSARPEESRCATRRRRVVSDISAKLLHGEAARGFTNGARGRSVSAWFEGAAP